MTYIGGKTDASAHTTNCVYLIRCLDEGNNMRVSYEPTITGSRQGKALCDACSSHLVGDPPLYLIKQHSAHSTDNCFVNHS